MRYPVLHEISTVGFPYIAGAVSAIWLLESYTNFEFDGGFVITILVMWVLSLAVDFYFNHRGTKNE